MVHNPEVLILDEPTAGVDPTGQIKIREILLNIARIEKKTVLLSSHNLDEVQRICNRIALIDRGEIKLYGELAILRQTMGQGAVVVELKDTISESTLEQLKVQKPLGFQDVRGSTLLFESREEPDEISNIIGFLAGKGVKIEKVGRREASLEDLNATILKAVEQK
jgi:ABC-2 type transport system ATP-binding protein